MAKIRGVALALACALGLGSTGCIKQIILDGQIQGTRQASAAIDRFTDYEIARTAAYSGVTQFEGMHYLAPENEDALFMLAKTWTSLTFAFIEDELEQAEDTAGEESDLYKYHKARAVAGYDQALFYGLTLLGKHHPGFEAAKKNDAEMKKWLAKITDEQDMETLFWTGYAWIGRVNVLKDEPAVVADLFVGALMVERVKELKHDYLYGSVHAILGAYHGRSPMAEVDTCEPKPGQAPDPNCWDAKREFAAAVAVTNGGALLPKLQLAAKYYCTKGDKASYVKTLTEVIEAGDTLKEQRLTNAIAKRRAKRYLGKDRMMRTCGF
jgi:TRAP transporter T-component